MQITRGWTIRDTNDTETYISRLRQTCNIGYSDLRFTTEEDALVCTVQTLNQTFTYLLHGAESFLKN